MRVLPQPKLLGERERERDDDIESYESTFNQQPRTWPMNQKQINVIDLQSLNRFQTSI